MYGSLPSWYQSKALSVTTSVLIVLKMLYLQEKIQNGNHTENGAGLLSDLAYIQCQTSNPLELFKEWHEEAKESDLVNPNVLCFSTSTK